MAFTPTMLGVTPVVSALSVAVNEWDVWAEVDDPTERFSAYDVMVGDVVFTDFVASTSAPGTVGRYTVQSILTRTATDIRFILRWGGVGDAVDPIEAAGQRGYLTKPSVRNGFAWHPRYNVLMVPQALIDGARNTETFAVTDTFLSGSSGGAVDQLARDRQTRVIPTSQVFDIGRMVALRGGVPEVANPAEELRMPAAGIVLGMGVGSVLIQTVGTTPVLPYTFVPGLPVFVSNTGGLTQEAASVSRPGLLQMVGMAADVNVVTLSITGQMFHRQ